MMNDRLLGRALRRTVMKGMQEFPHVFAAADGVPEVKIAGLDHHRALIIGAGVALGYGVKTQEQGLTGAVGRALHTLTGRGVVVHNRAKPSQSLEDAVRDLGAVGAATFNTVIWCPDLFDVMQSPERGRLRRALAEAVPLFKETARPGASIVLSGLPSPTDRGVVEEIARLFVPRFNRSLDRAAAVYEGVRVVVPPSFTSLADHAAFTPDYYDDWAAGILNAEEAVARRTA